MKKIFILFACLFTICSANISAFESSPVKISSNLNATTDNEIVFGFCSDDISLGIGATSGAAEVSAAIAMSDARFRVFAGKEISKIRIGLAANCTGVSVWIRSSLTGENLVSKEVEDANSGWHEVTLDEPFVIPSGDIYIGYTATGKLQIGFSGDIDEDAAWLGNSSSFDNYADQKWGSLCIQAVIDTKGIPFMDVNLVSLINSYTAINEPFNIKGVMHNISSEEITSVKVAYKIGEESPVEYTFTTSIAPLKVASFEIPARQLVAKTGIFTLSLTILEINGQPDTIVFNNTLSGTLNVFKYTFPKKIVVEEGTGTWCMWCTRGIVGMAMMKEKYPETFIGIAVHNDDVMTVTQYDNAMTSRFFKGFPIMVVNRKKSLIGDPYFDAENFYNLEMDIPTQIGVKLNGGFTNEDKKTLTLKTYVTFGYSGDVNFKLAYVLIENGVTGTESAFWQQNAYAGGYNGEMGGYERKPSIIKNQVYNDVARGIYSLFTGITNSIPAQVTELTPVEHNYKLTLPSSVQNKDSLEVAVLVLNFATGEIANADKIEIKSIYTGISEVEPASISAFIHNDLLQIQSELPVQGVELYGVSGQKVFAVNQAKSNIYPVNNLSQGVYIVKIKTAAGEKVFKVIK
ncbi:MAG: Omp28-related outer membrane protein [Dysgonamonadaceae bacterium]|jgi:hypothetical protein|nr:Omp28-related outer membrane protein [Dysgonamonadaceae bacterium]